MCRGSPHPPRATADSKLARRRVDISRPRALPTDRLVVNFACSAVAVRRIKLIWRTVVVAYVWSPANV